MNALRTRRRGAALEAAILDATWTELAAVGYERLSMEGVAARAGTSKAVLYRRWPNRADLLALLRRARDQALVLNEVAPDAVYRFFSEVRDAERARDLLRPESVEI